MKKFLLILLILFTHFQLLANENQDSKVTTNIAEQLKTLQDLYKSGILSGYEYEKEKKKILNK
tara:strand:- start:1076 stop:1264 length:189 start_codon:yes stop_codon:yes gene_type:complete